MIRVNALLLPYRVAQTCTDLDAATHDADLSRIASAGATGTNAMLRDLAPQREADVAISDCDDLFNAVAERLRMTVLALTSAAQRADSGDVRHVQSAVGECIEAFDHLHRSMANELDRRQHLEMELFDANTALAQARAELVGTQDGERRARHLALHDGLTSLPNRGYFVERLDQALSLPAPQRRPLSVMFLDLDGFKAVNDTHGHAVGDELLRIVAARLSRVVRAEDMVSRLGGDEFGCLLSGLDDREQLVQLAGKIFDAVSAPCKVGVLRLAVRASIGIAMSPGDGDTSDALLRNADAAMYHAKRCGLRHAFFAARPGECPAQCFLGTLGTDADSDRLD